MSIDFYVVGSINFILKEIWIRRNFKGDELEISLSEEIFIENLQNLS